MTSPNPYRPDQAKEALTDEGDYLLPICLPQMKVMVGQELSVMVFDTVEGQRVGLPLGVQALADLKEMVTQALAMMQAGDVDVVQ